MPYKSTTAEFYCSQLGKMMRELGIKQAAMISETEQPNPLAGQFLNTCRTNIDVQIQKLELETSCRPPYSTDHEP